MEVLLILLGVGFFLLGPIAFFLTLGARSRVELAERKVRALEIRIADAERRLIARPPGEDLAPSAQLDTHTSPLAPAGEATTGAGPAPTATESTEEAPPAETAQTPAPDATGVPENALPENSLPGGSLPGGSLPGRSLSPEPPPSAAPAAATPPRPTASLEERLGTRWAVWVGGLALAFGALLLVRQAVIQGFFGPGARITLGILFSAALVAAGEWLRRQERGSQDEADAPDRFNALRPSVPAMLTAAGTIGAFGSIYAAHGLYDFIGPSFAFILLGLIGVACMFAAALHGPMLAGLGLVGALATPLLISANAPTPWPVVLYLAVVAASAYALARLRRWLWLALATAAGGALWAFALASSPSALHGLDFYHGALLHLSIQLAMALYVLSLEPWRGADPATAKIDQISTLTIVAGSAVALMVLSLGRHQLFDGAWIAAAFAIVALFAATGAMALPSIIASAAAGALTIVYLALWRVADNAPIILLGGSPDLPVALPHAPGAFAAFALIASLGVAGVNGWRVLTRPTLHPIYVAIMAGVAALTPFLSLIVVYLRMTAGETSTLYAALACGLAAGFTLVAHMLRNGVRDGEPASWNLALGIFASAAIASLALGCVMVLDGGALTVALALAALGAAFVSVRLDIPAVRWCVVGFGVAVAARYVWEPRIHADIGATPIFNWLLFGYGVPAAAFGYGARVMRLARGEDMPVRIGEAVSILCAALLAFFEIRHFINGGDPYAATSKTVEIGLFAIASFGFALVLMQLNLRRHSVVMNAASYIFGVGAMAISAIGLGFAANPLLSRWANPVEGGAVFNGLLLAYLAPGLMALLIGRLAEGVRERWYVMVMRVFAVALMFGWLTLEVRRLFQGADIHMLRRTSNGEWYTYSIVWLAFGVILLAYGLWRRSIEVRAASAVFIVLSVFKVFLLDLAGLEGVLRALSFIGLGLVLIGIGLVYQKFVFVRKAPALPDAASTEP